MIDHGRWTAYRIWVLLLVSLVAMLDGMDSRVLALALPLVAREWGASHAAFAPVFAGSFVAMAAGALLGGVTGDRAGRRLALIGAVALFGATTIAGACADTIWSLGGWRLLASVGLGAAMPNVTTLLAEYTPVRRRGLALGLCLSALIVGKIAAGLMGAAVLPHAGWRGLFAVFGTVPLVLAALLLLCLPESLRFLVARGRGGAIPERLLRRLGHDVAPAVHRVDRVEDTDGASRAAFATLLGHAHRRDTTCVSLAFFSIFLSTYTISTWLPSLLVDAGYRISTASSSTSIFGVGGLLFGMIGAWACSRLGSRAVLVTLAAAAVVAMSFLAILFGSHGVAWRPALPIGLLAAGAIPGVQVAIYIVATQMFPTAVRATGVGLATAFGRAGSMLSAFAGPPLLAAGGRAYFGFVALTMTGAAVSLLLISRHTARAADSR